MLSSSKTKPGYGLISHYISKVETIQQFLINNNIFYTLEKNMEHLIFSIWPIINLGLIVGVCYLIYRWITKIISLKQEHNDLLREILKKMDNQLTNPG